MSDVVVIGLFDSVETAAAAGRALRAVPIPPEKIETISGVPLPDGAVVSDARPIRLTNRVIAAWIAGAVAGLALALVTYLDYPLITAGKAIISVPPTLIVTYEVAMLGALLATLVLSVREMGLPRRTLEVHDPRIHEGKILVCAAVTPGEEERRAAEAMGSAGGRDVRTVEGTP